MVNQFAEPTAPLNALTSQKTEWVWNDAHKQVFAEFKRRMAEAPIFVHAPHPTARFIVETDASLQVTGAVLYPCPLPELKQ